MKHKIVFDTADFCNWAMKKYNMSNNEWHKNVWRPFMCNRFLESSSSVKFEKTDNPKNIMEEQINDFIHEFSDFDGVWMEFTN